MWVTAQAGPRVACCIVCIVDKASGRKTRTVHKSTKDFVHLEKQFDCTQGIRRHAKGTQIRRLKGTRVARAMIRVSLFGPTLYDIPGILRLGGTGGSPLWFKLHMRCRVVFVCKKRGPEVAILYLFRICFRVGYACFLNKCLMYFACAASLVEYAVIHFRFFSTSREINILLRSW